MHSNNPCSKYLSNNTPSLYFRPNSSLMSAYMSLSCSHAVCVCVFREGYFTNYANKFSIIPFTPQHYLDCRNLFIQLCVLSSRLLITKLIATTLVQLVVVVVDWTFDKFQMTFSRHSHFVRSNLHSCWT